MHHLNGDKTDNRPENLVLYGNDAHQREHGRVYQELRRLRMENEKLRAQISEA